MIWCYCCSWGSKFAFLFIPTRLAPGVLLCKNQFLFSKRLTSASCHPQKKKYENAKQHLKQSEKQVESVLQFWKSVFFLHWILSFKKGRDSSLIKSWGYWYWAPQCSKRNPLVVLRLNTKGISIIVSIRNTEWIRVSACYKYLEIGRNVIPKKGDPVLQKWNKQFCMNSPKGDMGYKTIFLCCFLLAFQLAGVFSLLFSLSSDWVRQLTY